ncbi:MAG: hypothetical protein ABSB40_10865 [Nitrososphaeria archaeon]
MSFKGFNRFYTECRTELRSILEDYSLPERVLDFAGQILKQQSEIYFRKRSDALTRHRVIALTLIELSKIAPKLNSAVYIYLQNPSTPLNLSRQKAPTKSTKFFSKVEEVSMFGY